MAYPDSLDLCSPNGKISPGCLEERRFSVSGTAKGSRANLCISRLLHPCSLRQDRANETFLNDLFVEKLREPIGKTLYDIKARREKWERLRPWYFIEYNYWQLAPYYNVDARTALAEFRNALVPSLRLSNPLDAERKAWEALSSMLYWTNQHEIKHGVDAHWPPSTWFWHVVSMIMAAVLPRHDTIQGEYTPRTVKNKWKSSQAAASSRYQFPPSREIFEDFKEFWTLAGQHQSLYPDLEVEGEFIPSRRFLVRSAQEMYASMDSVFPLSLALGQALDAALTDLTTQAHFEKREDEWLDFSFELPPYDTKFVVRGDGYD